MEGAGPHARSAGAGPPGADRLGLRADHDGTGNQDAPAAGSDPRPGRDFPMPTRVPRSTIPACATWPRSSGPGPSSRRPWAAPPAPLFRRVEVPPPTRTVLPYGVGAYQQEPRLPAILTTGPGWASQEPEEKEAVAAQAFANLSQALEALKLDPPLRPTLTIQTPSGLELAWINDLIEGRKNIHGDEVQPLPTPQPPTSTPPPAAPPPPPTAVERGTKIHGDRP